MDKEGQLRRKECSRRNSICKGHEAGGPVMCKKMNCSQDD